MPPKGATRSRGHRPRRGGRGSRASNPRETRNNEEHSNDETSTSIMEPIPADFEAGGLPLESSATEDGTQQTAVLNVTNEEAEPAPAATSDAMDIDTDSPAAVQTPQPVTSSFTATSPDTASPATRSQPPPQTIRRPGVPFAGRRSKAERDAAEAAQRARRVDEPHDSVHPRDQPRDYASERGGRGGRGRGRGGRVLDAASRVATGVFGSGRVDVDNVPKSRPSQFQVPQSRTRDAVTAGPSASGSATTASKATTNSRSNPKIKRETDDAEAPEQGRDGTIKHEYSASSSSDSGDEESKERQNVDEINLLSDDEGDVGEASRHQSTRRLQPVRALRVEHQDRNLPHSVARGSKIDRKRALRNLKASDPNLSKGKHRAGELEARSSQRRWRGAYSDGESDDGVNVKAEPGTSHPGHGVPSTQARLGETHERKPRSRRTHGPDLQTPEDRAEHERHERSIENLLSELSRQKVKSDGVDTSMGGLGQPESGPEKIYLFQFPPVLPELRPLTVKPDPEAETNGDHDVPMASAEPTNASAPPEASAAPEQALPADAPPSMTEVPPDAPPVKLDPTGPANSATAAPAPPAPTTARLAPGRVGKLRVHASGKVSLDWGGTALELSLGADMDFPQDVVLTRLFGEGRTEELRGATLAKKPGKGKAAVASMEDEDGNAALLDPEKRDVAQPDGVVGGEACALGQIRGKFVVTPDWGEIL